MLLRRYAGTWFEISAGHCRFTPQPHMPDQCAGRTPRLGSWAGPEILEKTKKNGRIAECGSCARCMPDLYHSGSSRDGVFSVEEMENGKGHLIPRTDGLVPIL